MSSQLNDQAPTVDSTTRRLADVNRKVEIQWGRPGDQPLYVYCHWCSKWAMPMTLVGAVGFAHEHVKLHDLTTP